MRPTAGASGSAALVAALLWPVSSWALWDNRLELFAQENVTYDSNVFRLSPRLDPRSITGESAKSDTVATTTAGFILDVPLSLQRLQLEASWYRSDYRRFKDLDHDGHMVRGAWNWSVTPSVTGDVSYREQQVLANFANIQARRPDLVTTRMAVANGAWQLTPSWRPHATLTAGRTEHDDAILAATRDLENSSAEVGLDYVSAQENRLGVAARTERGRSPNDTLVQGEIFNNAYRQRSVGVQTRWVLTGLSRFDGRLDYTRREYDQVQQRNYSGPTFRATYTYTPTGKITVATTAQRDVAPLEDIAASFVLVTGVTVRPDWAITEKINIRGLLAYSVWDYRGDPGLGLQFTHRLRTAGLGVMYRPTTHISLVGALSHEARTSTLQFGDYEVNTASLEARIGF